MEKDYNSNSKSVKPNSSPPSRGVFLGKGDKKVKISGGHDRELKLFKILDNLNHIKRSSDIFFPADASSIPNAPFI